jgi:hypothetical protein
MRAPRSRGIGDARHRSHLTGAKHGNPVTVRWTRPATDRPTREESRTPWREQDGQEANGGSRKAAGKRRLMTAPSNYGRLCITGRIPDEVSGPERHCPSPREEAGSWLCGLHSALDGARQGAVTGAGHAAAGVRSEVVCPGALRPADVPARGTGRRMAHGARDVPAPVFGSSHGASVDGNRAVHPSLILPGLRSAG